MIGGCQDPIPPVWAHRTEMPIRNLSRVTAIGSVAPPPRSTIPAIVTARPPKRLDAHGRYLKLGGRGADAY
jgi:hypothetical protein